MLLFREALQIDEINKIPGSKKATVMVGRFQPPTIRHIDVLKDALSKHHFPVFVGIVYSATANSPFPPNLIKQILKANLGSDFHIFTLKDGFIGDWIDYLREQNYEPKFLICGSDRESTYQNQIDRYKTILNLSVKIDTSLERNANISGSQARECLRNHNSECFKKLVTPQTFKFYDKLERYY